MRPAKGALNCLAPALVLLLVGSSLLSQLVAAQTVRTTNLVDSCQAGWTLNVRDGTPCEFTAPEYIAYREYRQYYIHIPAGANYDLAITVSSNQGDVDCQLLAPNGTVLSSSAERIGEDVVQVGRTVLSKTPGNYTLVLQAVAQLESWYIIRTQTTWTVTRLAPEDKAVMSAIASQCCAPDDDLLPDSCTRLIAATSINATDDDDLCLQPPNICDAQGHLTKLVLSGGDRGNFVCPTFPEELGQLPALEVLDWTSNSQVGTLASVAAVMAPLAGRLKRLYLGRNALRGPLGCELVSGTALEILRLDRNLLTGSLPACMFQSPSLRQLSLSGNLLQGTIPQLPAGCALKLLDLSENGPPLGVSPSNPGMQGAFPEFTRAVNLTYVNLQSNSLTGTIPALPSGLQVLLAAYNRLSGPVPPSLETAGDLRVLDLSQNQLTGTVSTQITGARALTVLRLAANKLTGSLPNSGWGAYLMDVDLSQNSFVATEFSELLNRSSLIKLNLAANSLSFNIQEMAAHVPVNNSMAYFNISYNNVYGQLTESLGRMLLFNELLQQVQDDEALQGSLPPKPLFDISYNVISSPFPLKLLPLLDALYWEWPLTDGSTPLSVVLQPQQPPGDLKCPTPDTPFPPDVIYIDELQQHYDLSCTTVLGERINISAFKNVTIPRPPKRPGPPRPPPPRPPRPPVRRPPPGAAGNATSPSSGGPTGTAPQPAQLGDDVNGGGSGGTSSGRDGAGDGDGDGGSGEVVQPVASEPPPSSRLQVEDGSGSGGASKKSGGSAGAIAGGVVGGLLALVIVGGAIWYLRRRNDQRRNAYASKRVPLTFNTAYEAPSEGTASNYGDMQMFEFKVGDRPARHRGRFQ